MQGTAITLAAMFRRYIDGQPSLEECRRFNQFMMLNDLAMRLDRQMQAAGSSGVRTNLG